MTYSQLQTDILEYSGRSDVASKTSMFIRMAEAEIYRRVRVLEMETAATLEFSSALYEDDLPTGFLGFKRVKHVDAPEPGAVYVGPDAFASLWSTSPSDWRRLYGEASLYYTIEAGKVKVNQPPGAAEPIELSVVYWKRFTALADDNPTNTLLTNHPDLFLYAALAQLWDWSDETEMTAKYIAKFDKVLGQVDTLEASRRRPTGVLRRGPPRGIVV